MDFFDRVMQLPGLRVMEPFYKKYKEGLLYVFFGGLTFLVSVISYGLLTEILQIHELVSNVISWIIAVSFAFFTNRIWVFSSPTNGKKDFLQQMVTFFEGRLLTLGVEEIILWVFITMCGFPGMLIKIVAQIIVIVLNYIISKWWVFRKK